MLPPQVHTDSKAGLEGPFSACMNDRPGDFGCYQPSEGGFQ
jgi:hypothetical protein